MNTLEMGPWPPESRLETTPPAGSAGGDLGEARQERPDAASATSRRTTSSRSPSLTLPRRRLSRCRYLKPLVASIV